VAPRDRALYERLGSGDRARSCERGRPQRDSRQIAAILTWSTEHLLYVAGSGDDDNLPSEEAIIDTLVQVWLGAIY
jgi:hypothetical protein